MKKRLLAIFAHPDDEAFGPGGTLAKYGSEGVEIHLLCVTRGEAGIKSSKLKIQNSPPKACSRGASASGGDQPLAEKLKNVGLRTESDKDTSVEESRKWFENKIANIREKELLESVKVLGIRKAEFLGFEDGRLCNAIYHEMARKIMAKINDFKPQVVLTNDRLGVSGHLDHIAVSMITTYSFLKTKIAKKLYYYCLPKEVREKEKRLNDYFIYFPEGYDQSEITTRISYIPYWEKKVKAMRAHQTQAKDVEVLLTRFRKWPKVESFILQYRNNIKVRLPETDFFAGINY